MFNWPGVFPRAGDQPVEARAAMSMKTKGQMEAEISDALIKFEKEYMGRGPVETKTYIIDDLVVVRLKGVLTQAEYQLARSNESANGRELIKQVRITLLESGRHLLETAIGSITGQKVLSLHTDISTATGERMIIFTLHSPPRAAHGRA
jgi:uncharacterized protein YbcI